MNILYIIRFVQSQFLKGMVKHWSLDPLSLGGWAMFEAYQVCAIQFLVV